MVDETRYPRRGTAAVGVRCRRTDTVGRIENARVACCLVCSGACGYAAFGRARRAEIEPGLFAQPRP